MREHCLSSSVLWICTTELKARESLHYSEDCESEIKMAEGLVSVSKEMPLLILHLLQGREKHRRELLIHSPEPTSTLVGLVTEQGLTSAREARSCGTVAAA